MPTDILEAPEPTRTSLVTELLFPLPAVRRSPLGILMWWESRRLVYNVVVGVTGVATLAVISAISLIPPGLPGIRPPLVAILAYGALANICYTLQQLWKDKVLPVGPALFRQGLAFSVGLTLLPVVVVSGGWVVRLAMWLFGSPT